MKTLWVAFINIMSYKLVLSTEHGSLSSRDAPQFLLNPYWICYCFVSCDTFCCKDYGHCTRWL